MTTQFVQIPLRDPITKETNTVTVIAEPTDTPGLVIHPQIGPDGHFSGGWSVTHAASGLELPIGAWDRDLWAVRNIAAALGKTPVDWTGDTETVKAQATEHHKAVMDAIREGKYPTPQPDGPDTPKGKPAVAPYPETEAQATADVHDPGVQYQNCLNLISDLAAKGQLKDLPPTFNCSGSGSSTPVIVGKG